MRSDRPTPMCRLPSCRRDATGFTLVECLVALAILLVLAFVAVPGLGRMLAQQALEAHVLAFESALRLARLESVRRGVTVSVCILDDRSPDAPGCAPTAQGGWQAGWLVFADGGVRGDVDGEDRVLAVEQALAHSGQVVSTRRFISFHPSGVALNATGRYTFHPAGDPLQASAAVVVCVNKQGRARVAAGERGCS